MIQYYEMIATINKLLDSFSKKSSNNQNRFYDPVSLGSDQGLNSSRRYINAYQMISYIGQSVSIIAKDIASLKWKLINENGEEIENDQIKEFFNMPQAGIMFFDWISYIMKHLLLDGNSFLLIESSNAFSASRNVFDSAKILNPALVDVFGIDGQEVRAGTQTNISRVSHYDVDVDNMSFSLPPENVFQIQETSPANTLRGMGVIQQNSTLLDSDRLVTLFNRSFFKRGGMPSLVVMPAEDMGMANFQEFKKNINEDYSGDKNFEKIMIMPKGSSVETLDISHRDLEFIEQRKMTRSDVFGMFQIPPVISGITNDVKFNSASEQTDTYYDITLPRHYKVLENNLSVLTSMMVAGVRFEFIPSNRIKRLEETKISESMFDRGIISGNEFRENVGHPIDESDDMLNTRFITFNLSPVNQSIQPVEAPAKDDEKKSFLNISKKASRAQLLLHRQARKSKQKIEKDIDKSVRKFYTKMENDAIEGLNKGIDFFSKKDANIDDVFDFTEQFDEAVTDSKKFFTSAVVVSLNDFNRSFSENIDTSFKNPDIQLVVEKLSVRYADLTINSRRDELRTIIQGSVSEGVGISEIKGRIQDHFVTLTDGKQGWRATRIARTEAAYAYDQASAIGYSEIGVTTVDVVGCEDAHEPWDCNKTGFPISNIANLNFHPNHTGTVVPHGV